MVDARNLAAHLSVIASHRKQTVNSLHVVASGSPRVRLRLLGNYAVFVDGIDIGAPANAKSRSLLAYLALRRGERVRREVLMAEFWPDAEPTNARNNLKTALSLVRRSFRHAGFDPDAIVTAERDAIRWSAPVTVDVREIERCSRDVDSERSLAISLYDGELMPGDYNAWAIELRERLAARFEDILRAELAARPATELAERVLLLDPFCDDAYLALIDDALTAGNVREAQAVFRRYASALTEIGSTPGAALAQRVGLAARAEPAFDIGFVGRASQIAEIHAWLAGGSTVPPVLIVSGIAGIGKSALVAEALRTAAAIPPDLCVRDPGSEADGAQRVLWCVRPEALADARSAAADAHEIHLEGLTRGEIALALTRGAGRDAAGAAESLWNISLGHPLLVNAELIRLLREGAGGARFEPRFERDIVRVFEEQLAAAGDDAVQVAELLALEPELDADDLVALLDWSLDRVGEARARLTTFGIIDAGRPAAFRFPLFADVATRRFANGRRHQTIANITQRLTLHERPSAKRQLAKHYVTLGRDRDAAAASLEAGRAFVTFAAWTNALGAFDEGIAVLEGVATSSAATMLLRELYVARADVLNQLGHFPEALRSIDRALELIGNETKVDLVERATVLVKAGHAFSRLNKSEPAWLAAREAEACSRNAGALAVELEATSLTSRLHNNAMRYDEAVACASAGYERAMAAGEWAAASTLAYRVTEGLRRLLRFGDCYRWSQRQTDAAVLAGPEVEAHAHFAAGAVAYSVNQLPLAAEHARQGLRLLESIRRRQSLLPSPFGLAEWNFHQALAHVSGLLGAVGDALAECEWLVRSPWMFNTSGCAAMTLATVVDVRFLAGTADDHRAAIALAHRIPPIPEGHPGIFLDLTARARIAAITGSRSQAVELLHAAYAATVAAEPLVPDQIHISYAKLAQAADGLDDLLAARAAEAARRHRQLVIDAAGALWNAS
jgi:DNA-binding SARP family transcriptional activator